VGQPMQPGLGRRIVRADDPAGERGDRGDEQDPAEPPFPHGGHRGLGEQERGAQVHGQHLIELGGADVFQRLDAAQPSVADQHIHRAQRGGSDLDQFTGGLRAAQVGADRDHRAARCGDLRCQCLGGLAVGAVAEPQRCPADGQPARQRLSDAATRTGDKRNPAAE
jgi:hypothetical protein